MQSDSSTKPRPSEAGDRIWKCVSRNRWTAAACTPCKPPAVTPRQLPSALEAKGPPPHDDEHLGVADSAGDKVLACTHQVGSRADAVDCANPTIPSPGRLFGQSVAERKQDARCTIPTFQQVLRASDTMQGLDTQVYLHLQLLDKQSVKRTMATVCHCLRTKLDGRA